MSTYQYGSRLMAFLYADERGWVGRDGCSNRAGRHDLPVVKKRSDARGGWPRAERWGNEPSDRSSHRLWDAHTEPTRTNRVPPGQCYVLPRSNLTGSNALDNAEVRVSNATPFGAAVQRIV